MLDPSPSADSDFIEAEVLALSSEAKSVVESAKPVDQAGPDKVAPYPLDAGNSEPTKLKRKQLTWFTRILSLMTGMLLLALLVIARGLTPSPSGFGTHQQLGLPPCTAIVLLNIPCPACGMTTSWSHTLRGNLVAAAQSNAGGMLLALIAMAFLPASCYFFLRGKASTDGWFSLVLAICLVAALGVSLVQWVIRLLN